MMMRKLYLGAVCLSALTLPALSADHSGKAVYDQTCKECHGAKGNGNAMADKFYKVAIPKLQSEYVQDKSDTELKEIITGGRRKMPAVQAGTPSVKHALSAEDVDGVIAYVRTLKKK